MNYILNPLRFAYRKKRYDTQNSVVMTYRCSAQKPEKINGSSVSLFHRPRIAMKLFQIAAFGAVAVWTVHNYVHILKSL